MKNEFIRRFRKVDFKFLLYHDLQNSKILVLIKNHLIYFKDNIFQCFFKKCNRPLFFKKINSFHNI